MALDDKSRTKNGPGRFRRWASRLATVLLPTERNFPTREGLTYASVSLALLFAGLYQQVNLILLVFTLTAGPVFASIFSGRSMLRRLVAARRAPSYVFSGDPLCIEYVVSNGRRYSATLALFLEDSLVPVDRTVSGAATVAPKVFFARVGGGERSRVRWVAPSPKRGKYRFRDLDLGTRAPFGIVEHRVTIASTGSMLVYPRIGQLSRRWFQLQRQAMESRRGKRHDRSAQQVEYHGLRDYRSGDSPRWIHWRTTARRNELMVKEFEQHNEQDVAILVDPWLPRTKASPEQRDAVELTISFAATLCLEICRHQGRRLVLGWTGPAPGVRQGPASVKLLHDLLEQLAVMRSSGEGGLAALFDIMPAPALREAILVIVSTRPINLIEEAERSARLAGTGARSLPLRVILLNAAQGDLNPLFKLEAEASNDLLHLRSTSAIEERLASQDGRRRAAASDETAAGEFDRTSSRDGAPARE
jgi:uncharacterized protein (DUF58 family)